MGMHEEDKNDPFSFGGFIEEQAKAEQERQDQEEQARTEQAERGTLGEEERAWHEAHIPPKINRLVNDAEARRFADQEAVARVARRDAAQRNLALSNWKGMQERGHNRQMMMCVLDIVARRIREGLCNAGIGVVEVQPNKMVQVPARHFHIDFQLEDLRNTDLPKILSDKFLDLLLAENPNRVHMFCYRLELPRSVEFAGHYECDGLVMRAVCDYDIRIDKRVVRLDLMHSNADEEHVKLLALPTSKVTH